MGSRQLSRGLKALALAVALGATTAASASAATTITLAPTTADFGSVTAGKSSGPLVFKLEIRCDVFACNDFFSPTPAITNPAFQLLNLCPAQISYLNFFAGDDDPVCYIVGRFTPTAAGPQSTTLSTGTGGPTATLTGTGLAEPAAPQTQARCKKGKRKGKGASAAKCKRKKKR
jgi:hypothetical protein